MSNKKVIWKNYLGRNKIYIEFDKIKSGKFDGLWDMKIVKTHIITRFQAIFTIKKPAFLWQVVWFISENYLINLI